MSRRRKYKTEAERKAAQREAARRWQRKNRERVAERNAKLAASGTFEMRLAALEAEVAKFKEDKKEILLSLDECLKENKRLADSVKWGKR